MEIPFYQTKKRQAIVLISLRKYRSLIFSGIILLLAAASLAGRARSSRDLEPHIFDVFGENISIEESDGIFRVYDSEKRLLGWAAAGSASGYGGPLTIISGIDTAGTIIGSSIVDHKETPVFFMKIKPDDFFNSISTKHFSEAKFNYEEVDGVTGASRSVEALEGSIKDAVSKIAFKEFNTVLEKKDISYKFGIPEAVILLLFIAGILCHYLKRPVNDRLRWVSQITGLLVIGFWENSPITISKITTILSGYIPDLHTNLRWYLLLSGFALTAIVYGKNIYCTHVCPFGAAQRCVGIIGGARIKVSSAISGFAVKVRNALVFSAIIAALIITQPTSAGFEPFAALFALKGTTSQWILLSIVIISSLFIKTPWCNYFCPVRSCESFLLTARGLFKETGRIRFKDSDGVTIKKPGKSIKDIVLTSFFLIVFSLILWILLEGFLFN